MPDTTTATHTPDTVVTIDPKPASEPGALDGWAIHCEACGCVVAGTSLRTQADRLRVEHLHYMLSRGR